MTTYRERHLAGLYETSQTSQTETPQPEAEPEAFICDVCGRDFGTQQGLTLHQTKAHTDDEEEET